MEPASRLYVGKNLMDGEEIKERREVLSVNKIRCSAY